MHELSFDVCLTTSVRIGYIMISISITFTLKCDII